MALPAMHDTSVDGSTYTRCFIPAQIKSLKTHLDPYSPGSIFPLLETEAHMVTMESFRMQQGQQVAYIKASHPISFLPWRSGFRAGISPSSRSGLHESDR